MLLVRRGRSGGAGWHMEERRRQLAAMMEEGESDEEPNWDAVAIKARRCARCARCVLCFHRALGPNRSHECGGWPAAMGLFALHGLWLTFFYCSLRRFLTFCTALVVFV